MRINHNISAIHAWRESVSNQNQTGKSLEKLSSGQRINRASDDAAGFSISEKMRSQVRGLSQASRNMQDGISLIQTAEGGLQETHALLQRGRELAVQAANGTNTAQDKMNIQAEVNQITKEVDRIAQNTEFNTISLLNTTQNLPGASQVLANLKNSWLRESALRIHNFYNIDPDNVNFDINLIQGSPGGVLAYVSSMVNGSPGLGTNVSLTIEMADYNATTNSFYGISADRIIAHEMVHGVMARTMDWSENVNGSETTGIATWWREGTAELIHGADERVAGDLGTTTPTLGQAQTLVNRIGGVGTPWGGTSADYSAAYVAARYMDFTIKAAGGGGIVDIMNQLKSSSSMSLDTAIKNVATASSIAAWSTGVAGFKSDFASNGAAFMLAHINLTNPDTGAIGGLDASAGAALTDITVIPDNVAATDPTAFNEIYPNIAAAAPLVLQVGANDNQNLAFNLSKTDSASLGLANVDVINGASSAIDQFQNAIDTVSAERAKYGALQNRLEHALATTDNYNENLTASESRIRDTDIASEMMGLTKSSILSEASRAMLAQANQSPQGMLQLLKSA